MKTIKLKAGKERSLLRRHPWIFESAIGDLNNDVHTLHALRAGETIRIEADEGRPLAVASYSPKSQIRARVWSFDPETIISRTRFAPRLRAGKRCRSRAMRIARCTVKAIVCLA
jgi:23S rRNA (cytosine1962-C5)-methyltransferase